MRARCCPVLGLAVVGSGAAYAASGARCGCPIGTCSPPPTSRSPRRQAVQSGLVRWTCASGDQAAEPNMTGAFDDSGAIWVGQLELADSLWVDAVIEPDRAFVHWARVLVRLHHEPLASVTIPSPGGRCCA